MRNLAKKTSKKLVPISAAAGILGVSVDTVRRWDKQGKLKSVRPNGKDRYFAVSELKAQVDNKPLTITKAALELGVSPSTLRRIEARGGIHPNRNEAGKRQYSTNILSELKNSEYFQIRQLKEHQLNESGSIMPPSVLASTLDAHARVIKSIYMFKESIYFVWSVAAVGFLVTLTLVTFYFLVSPEEAAHYFDLTYIESEETEQLTQVLGHTDEVVPYANETQYPVAPAPLIPFSRVSLELVKIIDYDTYQKIKPKEEQKLPDLFTVDNHNNLIPGLSIYLPSGSMLAVGDRQIISGLSAEYLQGQELGENEGDILFYTSDGQVSSLRIAEFNLLDSIVTTEKILDSAVTADKIADKAITASKLADEIKVTPGANSITTGMIVNGTVNSDDIEDGVITTSDLAGGLEFANGDYIDLSLVTHTTTAKQGLLLPNVSSATPTSPSSGQGYLAFDTTGDQVIVYDGTDWVLVGSGDIEGVSVGDGLSGGGTSGNLSIGLSLDSGSGLATSSTGLSLLRTCSDGEILKWDDGTSSWLCATDTGGGGGGAIVVQHGDTTVSATTSTLDFLAADFIVGETPSGEANISLDYANSGIARIGENESVSGAWSFGNGLTVSLGSVSLPSGSIDNTELVDDTINFSKIASALTLDEETTISASGALNLLVGNNVSFTATGTGIITATDLNCTNCIGATEISDLTLGTDTSGSYVATISSGNGVSGTATGEGSTPTLALSALTANWNQTGAFDVVLNNSSSELTILDSDGTHSGTIDIGNLAGDAVFTFTGGTGTVLTDDNADTLLSAWDQTASDDLTTGNYSSTLDSVYVNVGETPHTDGDISGNYSTGLTIDSGTIGDVELADSIGYTGALTVSGGGTITATDLSCTDCIGASEISESSISSTGLSDTANIAYLNQSETVLNDWTFSLAETEDLAISWSVSGTQDGQSELITLTNASSSGTQNGLVINNAASTGTTDALVYLDNSDTDTVVSSAIQIANSSRFTNILTIGATTLTASELALLDGRSGTLLDTNNVATSLSAWDQNASDDLTTGNYAATLDSVYVNAGESPAAGDVSGSFSGGFTIGLNSVALGDDTTGNYVAGATTNGGLTLTGTEGGTLGVSVQASKGLEVNSDGLSLIDCGDTQILKYSTGTNQWSCQDDETGGGSGSLDDAYNNGATVTVDASDILFDLNDATNDYGFVIDNNTNATIDTAFEVTTAAGASSVFTTALDVSDAGIATALALGSNDVTVGGVTIGSAEFGLLDGRSGTLLDTANYASTLDSIYVNVGEAPHTDGDISGNYTAGLTIDSGSVDDVELADTLNYTGALTLSQNLNANGGLDVDDAFVVADGGAVSTLSISDTSIALTGASGEFSFNAAGTRTFTITNADGSNVANLSVEGTITGSNFSGTSSGTNTGDQNVWSQITTPDAGNPSPDGTADTLTLANGSGVAITSNGTTDTITVGLDLDYSPTWTNAHTFSLAEAEDLAINWGVSGTQDGQGELITITNSSSSGTQNGLAINNAASTGTTDTLVYLDNSDTDTVVTNAIQIANTSRFTNIFNIGGTGIDATELSLLNGRSGTLLDTNNVATQLSAWDQNSSDDLTTGNYAATLDSVYVNAGESPAAGDISGSFSGGLTIGTNSVELGTDTTGNYVAGATSNGGLTLTGTEGGSLGILLPTATDDLSSTSSNGSGLVLTSAGLSLLQGCGDGQILEWDEDTDVWACGDDTTGGGTGSLDDAYNNGGTITVDSYDILLNLANATSDYGLVLDNTTTGDIANAFEVTTTGIGGTFATAIVLSDGGIGDAIDVGGNDITGTTYTIEASSALTLGDAATGTNTTTVSIFSSDWEISSAGALTGISFDANGSGNSISNIDNADLTDDTINFDKIASALTLDEETTISAAGALNLLIGNNVSLTTTGTGAIVATDLSCTDCIGATEISEGGISSTGLSDTANIAYLNQSESILNDWTFNLAEAEDLAVSWSVSGTQDGQGELITITNSSSSGAQNGLVINNAVSTGTTDALVYLDNSDTDTVVTNAIQIANSTRFTNILTIGAVNLTAAELGLLDGRSGTLLDTANYASTLDSVYVNVGEAPHVDGDISGNYTAGLTIDSGSIDDAELADTLSYTGALTLSNLTISDTSIALTGASGEFSFNAAGTRTFTITNADGSNVANLSVEGDVAGASITVGGDTIDEFAGTGLTVSSGDLTVNQATAFAWTGQQSFTNTLTTTGSQVDFNLTLGDDDDVDTVSAINVDVTSVNTGDADVLRGLDIANLSGANSSVSEQAIKVGTGWDSALVIGNNSIFTGAGVLQSIALQGTYSQTLTLSNTSNSITAGTVDINGGAIDGTTIGSSTASSGAFTTISASGLISANGGITLGADDDIGNATWSISESGVASGITGITADSVNFANVAAGTNTNALVIGTNGSLSTSGTGTITATDLSCTDCIGATEISEGSIASTGLSDTANIGYLNQSETVLNDWTFSLAEAEDLAVSWAVSGTQDGQGELITITNSSSSGTQNGLSINNAASTGTTDALVYLDNSDTDTVVTNAIQVANSTRFTNILTIGAVNLTATELSLLDGRSGTLLDSNNVATTLSAWDQNASDDLTTGNYAATLDSIYVNVGEAPHVDGDISGNYTAGLTIDSGSVDDAELADTLSYTGALTLSQNLNANGGFDVDDAFVVADGGAVSTISISDTSIALTGASSEFSFNAAGTRTFTITNADGSNVANLSVEGDVAGASLTVGGDTIDEFAGTGLTISSGDLIVNQATAFSWTGQQSFTNTLTATGSVQDVNLTLGNDDDVDTISGINIDVTSATTGDADVVYGLNVGNLSSADSTVLERAIRIGSGWDEIIDVNGTLISSTELILLDGRSGTLLDSNNVATTLSAWDQTESDDVNVGDSPNAAGDISGTYTAGLTIDDNTIDDAELANTLSYTGVLTLSNALTLANSETISVPTDATFTFTRNNAGTVTITSADDNADAALSIVSGGTGILTLDSGSGTVTIAAGDTLGNGTWSISSAGVASGITGITADSVNFANVAAGTNVNTLVIGTGGSLATSGTGTITATDLSCTDCIGATEISESSIASTGLSDTANIGYLNQSETVVNDWTFSLAEAEDLAVSWSVSGTQDGQGELITIANSSSSGTQNGLSINNAANTGTTDALIHLDNSDTDTVVTNAIQIANSTRFTNILTIDAVNLTATELGLLDGRSGTLLDTANYASTLDAVYVNVGEAPHVDGDISGNYTAGLTIDSGSIDDAELADTLSYTGALTLSQNLNANGGLDVDDAFVVADGGAVSTLSISDTSIALTGASSEFSFNAAGTRTFTITNADGSNVANLGVEGDVAGASITVGGDTIDEFAGTGLTVSSGDLIINQATAFAWTGQQSWTNTVTATGSIQDINLTLGNDDDVDTISGINIDVTSATTGDADVVYGVNVGNLSSADGTVLERAIRIGSGWDEVFDINGTLISSAELTLLNGRSGTLLDTANVATELSTWDQTESDDVNTGDSPNAAGDISGNYTAGLTIDDNVVDDAELANTLSYTGALTLSDLTVSDTSIALSGASAELSFNAAGTRTFTITNADGSNVANLSVEGTITGSNLSGSNTGDQTITLEGDVTGTGTGTFTTTIADASIDYQDLDQIDGDTPGDEECLTYESGGANGTFEWQSCGAGGGSLDTAYNSGGTITVDAYDVLFDLNDGTNDYGLVIDNNTAGAIATALEFTNAGGGGFTNEIVLQNGEAISNASDNQINLTLGTSGTLLLTSGTAATITNSAGALTIDSVGNSVLVGSADSLGNGTWSISSTGAGTSLTSTDLNCTNCIGGTEIDESTLSLASTSLTDTANIAYLNASNAFTVANQSVTGTITNTSQLYDLNLTLGNDDDVDTVSGINIDVSSAATGDADVVYGLNVGNLSSADGTVLERAIRIGSGWDAALDLNGTLVTSTELGILSSGVNYGELTNSGTLTVTTADINGGNIDGTIIGASSAAAGTFTTATATTLTDGTATLTGGALTGVASIDTISVSATAMTFAAAGTISSTSADLNLVTTTSGNIVLDPASTGSVQITSAVTTGTGTGSGLSFVDNSLTTGTGMNLATSSNSFTGAGTLLNLAATGTDIGSLMSLDWTGAGANTSTADIFTINVGTDEAVGSFLNITNDGSTVFKVTQEKITSAIPHEFTAAGDVSFAYDIVMTNQTSSFIESNAPLTIRVGEAVESNDLTLTTYNSGSVIITNGATAISSIDGSAGYAVFNVLGKSDTGDPASCNEGDIYYNDNDNTIKICHETNTWEALDGGGGGSLDTAYDSGGSITVDAYDVLFDLNDGTNDYGIVIDNNTASAIAVGLEFTNAGGGGFTTGINMGNFTVENIGAAGTDFTGTGGLTLADALGVTSGGISITAGALAVNSDSVTSDGALTIDANDSVVLGGSGNTFTFDESSGPLYAGTARPAKTVTLVPEYQGAVLTGDGGSNTGTMTSDFCSDLRGINTNATPSNSQPCDSDLTEEHNYYTWTSTSATQDYDIWVRWQVPSDFAAFAASDAVQAYGWRTDGTNAVTVYMYDTAGTLDNAGGTNVATGTAAWTVTTVESAPGGTYTQGSYVTFQIHLSNDTANDHVKVGEIEIDYLARF